MHDWKSLTLAPLTPRERIAYARWMERKCQLTWNALDSLYERYKRLPNEVAANLIHRDMQRPGWSNPPQSILNEVCAKKENVEALFVLCAHRFHPDIDSADYVTDENYREVYNAILDLHLMNDRKQMADAAAAFCRETQLGGLR
jgi:hypothetical protein